MIKRTVEVSTQGTHLASRLRQLVVSRDKEQLATIPFEDIGVLVLDSQGISMTSAALIDALESGASVMVCDGSHHPAGMLLPFAAHTTSSERIRHQVMASKPLIKNLWANIIRAKIANQAALLDDDDPARTRLNRLKDKVKSGDPANAEAQASRAYWQALFSPENCSSIEHPFLRRRDGLPPNGLLNYGYAVLRAAVARAICASGLNPTLGLHHHNRYNAFCLADDLMEPYRPWVDARVCYLVQNGVVEIEAESKRHLLEVLTDRVEIGGGSGPLLVALERSASSLASCFESFARLSDAEDRGAVEIAKDLLLPNPPEVSATMSGEDD